MVMADLLSSLWTSGGPVVVSIILPPSDLLRLPRTSGGSASSNRRSKLFTLMYLLFLVKQIARKCKKMESQQVQGNTAGPTSSMATSHVRFTEEVHFWT